MKIKHRVVILGPVSSTLRDEESEQFANVRRMCIVASQIAEMGATPVVPALCSFWNMLTPRPREFWIDHSKQEILRSDVAFRMTGLSVGADAEVVFCREHGIPVCFRAPELVGWLETGAPPDRAAYTEIVVRELEVLERRYLAEMRQRKEREVEIARLENLVFDGPAR